MIYMNLSATGAMIGRDGCDSLWYYPDMATSPRPVPQYDLYGDAGAPVREEFFHCETIRIRSERYQWEIAPHVHPGLAQILFVATGQVELHLSTKVEAFSGPVLVRVPCGTVHGFHFSSDVDGLVVTVSQDFLDSLSRHDSLREHLQGQAVDIPTPDRVQRLRAVGQALLAAERDRFALDAHRLHQALGEAWLRIAVEMQAGTAAGSALVERFQALVENHYRAHKPLDFYAGELGCTMRTLSRQVSAAFGITPLQFINRRLLFEARRLLRFTNASCAEVADELGFEDPSYFSRFYLRLAGKRPSADRTSIAAGEDMTRRKLS